MKTVEGHISRSFDGALGALHLHVIAMGSLALDQVRTAARAYVRWDRASALTVVDREQAINAYDEALDEEQLLLLARRQPMASDLKFVIAFSRAVAELERVGDESKKIARIVIEDEAPFEPASTGDVEDLAGNAVVLLRQALDALDTLDAALGTRVIAADKDLDTRYGRAIQRLLSRPPRDAEGFRRAIHAAFVMKSLERIGDHARNLARLLQS